jgi:hypothetical protein
MRIRAYGSIHTALSTYIVIHHRRNTHAKRPRLHYIHHMHLHASSTDTGHAIRNGNDSCGYFCSANGILEQTRESFWWMAQRIVDYYEHVGLTISFASISAPLLNKSSTMARVPSWHATCNGVLSTFVLASLLIPERSKTSAVPRCPLLEAKCNGDVPSWKMLNIQD